MKQTELTERGFSRSALFGLTAAATLFIVGCSQLQGGSEPAPQSVDSGSISDDPGGEGQDNGGGGGGGAAAPGRVMVAVADNPLSTTNSTKAGDALLLPSSDTAGRRVLYLGSAKK